MQQPKNHWSQYIGMGPWGYQWPLTRPPSKLSCQSKILSGRVERRYLHAWCSQPIMYSPHLHLHLTQERCKTLRYKCNLTNQHICELFQSSIQTNSTKQNPFCSLNINDQEDISAWIIFIAISIISSLVTLPPSQPSQVATLIFCLASRATIKTKIKPSKQRKLV